MSYEIQLIRHATLVVRIQHLSFLVDPMLSRKEAMDPVTNAANSYRFPMVDLPFGDAWTEEMVETVDAVCVTHLHRDHWDTEAIDKIPKHKPIFCQPWDAAGIRARGFTQVVGVESSVNCEGISIIRTDGRHGIGEIGEKMGRVSGFIIGSPIGNIYLAGDTVWCEEVKQAIVTYRPSSIIVNAGGARFLQGGPITMNADDVIKVYQASPTSLIIAVHMDTVNHCLEKRSDLRSALEKAGLSGKIHIPQDGEFIRLAEEQ